jgi:hypothetical protein
MNTIIYSITWIAGIFFIVILYSYIRSLRNKYVARNNYKPNIIKASKWANNMDSHIEIEQKLAIPIVLNRRDVINCKNN